MKGVVSGRPRVLAAGTVLSSTASVCANNVRHPRTGIGLSADKKKLILIVADGRSSVAAGLTCSEVGALLKSLGAAEGNGRWSPPRRCLAISGAARRRSASR